MNEVCTDNKYNVIISWDFNSSSKESCGSGRTAAAKPLLLTEGHTVGTLVHSRICLMGTHQNTVQAAVVGIAAVMCALLYGAFNTLVGIAVHIRLLLFLRWH